MKHTEDNQAAIPPAHTHIHGEINIVIQIDGLV